MPDSLAALLALPNEEKQRRGLTDTPREIEQQPKTWRGTMRALDAARASVVSFLEQCGIAPGLRDQPEVILAGAGTSDYIGRALSSLLQEGWGTNVRSIPACDIC
jgi:tagatose-6-phosphate ketose/aldose isomerase